MKKHDKRKVKKSDKGKKGIGKPPKKNDKRPITKDDAGGRVVEVIIKLNGKVSSVEFLSYQSSTGVYDIFRFKGRTVRVRKELGIIGLVKGIL